MNWKYFIGMSALCLFAGSFVVLVASQSATQRHQKNRPIETIRHIHYIYIQKEGP